MSLTQISRILKKMAREQLLVVGLGGGGNRTRYSITGITK